MSVRPLRVHGADPARDDSGSFAVGGVQDVGRVDVRSVPEHQSASEGNLSRGCVAAPYGELRLGGEGVSLED